MPTYKCTWFYNDTVDNTGWTETWWVTAPNADGANVAVTPYDTKRLALLLDTTVFAAFRVCNVDEGRDSRYYNPTAGLRGSIAAATNPSAGVWDCLLARRDNIGNDLLGHMFMHQVPAGIFNGRIYINAGGTPAAWYTAWTAFVNEVTGGNYLLRKSVGGGFVYQPCASFTPMRRTTRRLGRPGDPLRGRRRIA